MIDPGDWEPVRMSRRVTLVLVAGALVSATLMVIGGREVISWLL